MVLSDSRVLYAYLMYIHTKSIAHSALEPTVKEVFKKMKVIKGLRRLIKKIIADCVKYRMMEKKTLELKTTEPPGGQDSSCSKLSFMYDGYMLWIQWTIL